MKGITGLAHIGVRVSDMQRSLKFYVNDLGFELVKCYERAGGTVLAFLQAGSCIIELICSPKVDVSALKPGHVDHICLECDDVEGFMAQLGDKVERIGEIGYMDDVFGGTRNIFFKGPDGERIELFQYTSKLTHID